MKTPLYISDLDGTLLDSNARLSPVSHALLAGLLREGLPFTIATARSVASVATLLRGLPLTLPVIEFNGAFLSDLHTGAHHVVNELPRPTAHDLYELVTGFGCVPLVAGFDGREDCVWHRDAHNDGVRWYLEDRERLSDSRLRRVDDLRPALDNNIVCLTVIGEESRLTELECAIAQRHGAAVVTLLAENRYSPDWHWLTVHDHRATKDQGIRSLIDACGLEHHELVVFGDYHNDRGMFGMAHRAIAVSNAIAELRDAAHLVIGSNDEDSVARFIDSDWARHRSGASP